MSHVPPLVLSLLLCVAGYAGVAVALLPNATDSAQRDLADEELQHLAAGAAVRK